MSTILKNLSEFSDLPNAESFTFGIVVSEWNTEITGSLLEGALALLKTANVSEENIKVVKVPGTYELAYGAQKLAISKRYDAILCLGCVIQGETKHFDFICAAAANGIMRVGLDNLLPVIFGVLTTDTQEQAQARSGGKYGNKGIEAAYTAIKMLA